MYYMHVLMSGNNALAAAKRRRVGVQTPNQSMSNTNLPPVQEEEGGQIVMSPADALATHAFQISQINKVVDKFFIEGGVFHRLEEIEKKLAALQTSQQETKEKKADSEIKATKATKVTKGTKGNVALDISDKGTEPTFSKK